MLNNMKMKDVDARRIPDSSAERVRYGLTYRVRWSTSAG
jgi:hypothetical protein